MANETNQALSNQQGLDALFQQSLSPVNNFVSQSTALAIGRQREQEAQMRELFSLRQQQAFQAQQNDLNRQLQITLAQQAESARHEDVGTEFNLRRTAQLEDQRTELANNIRKDPYAQRIMKFDTYKNDDTGNQKLITDYDKLVTNPEKEKLDVKDLTSIEDQMAASTKEMLAQGLDPLQKKQALQKFFSDPTVLQAFAKNGKFTAEEIRKMVDSGNDVEVSKAIDLVADRASWFGVDEKLQSGLQGALMSAVQETGAAAQSPVAALNLAKLQAYAKRHADLVSRINPEALGQVAAARVPKLPPANPFTVSGGSPGYSPAQSAIGATFPTAPSTSGSGAQELMFRAIDAIPALRQQLGREIPRPDTLSGQGNLSQFYMSPQQQAQDVIDAINGVRRPIPTITPQPIPTIQLPR